MPKEEREFFDTETIDWVPAGAGSGATAEGVMEKILSQDPETGNYARMVNFPAGVETDETIAHDFWEEVIIIEGSLIDTRLNQEFPKGFYGCRPPGMPHGPYKSPNGCITFELRYYDKK